MEPVTRNTYCGIRNVPTVLRFHPDSVIHDSVVVTIHVPAMYNFYYIWFVCLYIAVRVNPVYQRKGI